MIRKVVKYNKLIRDKIPQIIKDDGWIPKTRILNKKEFRRELKKKVLEETKELIKAEEKEEVIDEIVDIQEITDALIREYGLTKLIIKAEQKKKNKKRGGFKKRLFLIKSAKKES